MNLPLGVVPAAPAKYNKIMLYQNRQVVLSQLSPFSGQYLAELNRSVERPGELCHNCARGELQCTRARPKPSLSPARSPILRGAVAADHVRLSGRRSPLSIDCVPVARHCSEVPPSSVDVSADLADNCNDRFNVALPSNDGGRELPLRVDFACSPQWWGMTAVCAFRPKTGVEGFALMPALDPKNMDRGAV
jgi:hypothetical protein